MSKIEQVVLSVRRGQEESAELPMHLHCHLHKAPPHISQFGSYYWAGGGCGSREKVGSEDI